MIQQGYINLVTDKLSAEGYNQETVALVERYVIDAIKYIENYNAIKYGEQFMLVNEKGTHNPTFVHYTKLDAFKEAQRLTEMLGAKTRILKVVGEVYPELKVKYKMFDTDEELPF